MYRLLETTESEVKVLYCNTFMVFFAFINIIYSGN